MGVGGRSGRYFGEEILGTSLLAGLGPVFGEGERVEQHFMLELMLLHRGADVVMLLR